MLSIQKINIEFAGTLKNKYENKRIKKSYFR